MPRDEQDRARRGEGARKAAERNQAQAAGRGSSGGQPPGFVPGSGLLSQPPTRVQIVNGETDFFNELKSALGLGGTATAGSGGTGTDQLRANLRSQDAMSQATKQIADEVKSAVSMMRTLQMSNLQLNVQLSQHAQAQSNQMSILMDSISSLALGGGGAGGGHGGHSGGGGGSHGGGMGYNPSTNQYVSYGNLQSRLRASVANRLKQNGQGSLASGVANGGLMGGLRRMGNVWEGGIGGAIAVGATANQGAEWMTQQRADNAYYQSIYNGGNVGSAGELMSALGMGTSQVTGGLANRIQEQGFVLGQRFSPGGMTGQQATQAYQGISALGLNGQARSNALNFVSNSYQSMGMDPGMSTQVAQVATRYAQTNLDGVYQSLLKVSQAAQLTGQSADTLRQTFIGNYQGALASGAQGGSAGLAQAMTMATAAGGRNLQGFSYAGMLQNPNTMYSMSAMVGMTPTQMEYQTAMGNPMPQAQAMTQFSGNLMQSALGGQGMQILNQLVQQAGGADKVKNSPGTMTSIATKMMQYVDLSTIMSLPQTAGISVPQGASPEQILVAVVNHMVGNNPAAEAAQAQKDNQVSKVSQSELDAGKTGGGMLGGITGAIGGVTGAMGGFGQFTGLTGGAGESNWTADQYRQQANAASGFMATIGDSPIGKLFGGNSQSQAADTWGKSLDAYKAYQSKYGNVQDPAIQKAIEQFGQDPSMRVRVRTKDGTDRAVSLAEAIQYYPDQLSTGQAIVMSNDPNTNGQSLAQLGVTPSLQQNALLPNEADTTTSGQEYGQSAKDQEKNFNPKAAASPASSGGQNVTIDFAPGAAQTLLRVVGSSAPNSRPPAATNGPS